MLTVAMAMHIPYSLLYNFKKADCMILENEYFPQNTVKINHFL